MRSRGLSLIGVLWFVGMVLALTLAALGLVEGVRGRVAAHKLEQSAACMAASGADYAEAMLARGRWKGACTFRSPDLKGGRFTLEVTPTGSRYRIASTGEAGPFRHRVETSWP